MLRRGLLAGSGLALVALGWPGWLRKAFLRGTSSQAPLIPRPEDPGAMRRPLPSSSTVLFFVIPRKEEEWWTRGHILGEFLNHGKSEDLALLADVAIECATLKDINARFGSSLREEPLMLLARVAGASAQFQPIQPATPDLPLPRARGTGDPAVDGVIQKRIDAVAASLRQALGSVPSGEVDARAERVRQAVVKKPPRNGQWASSSGCGIDYEEGPEVAEALDCGMGFVPERSQRFLHFLTAESGKQRR